ncbi:MAG: aminotransferase class I/II-fold pyridoxal phosphate-dependent enzyme [Propionibacteriaceae bacterium]|jgi:cystathionine beta-lyase|nr:aminotransferase class I/II-fold pyridoxal phosphate-dependent enzyme [Propionibacteriaceae bacterium]
MPVFSLTEAQLRRRRSMKWQAYPADVLPLWVAEMDCAIHPAIAETIRQLVDDGDTGYPSGRAYADAFRGLAAKRWGWDIADGQVRQSGDVMNSILGVLQTITEPGDAVVINPPVYPPFRTVTAGYGRKVVEVHLTPEGRLDIPAMEAAFAGPDRPKACLLCSPHNPTGTVHTAAELAEVVRLANRHGVRVVVDEIHAPIVAADAQFTPILTVPGADGAIAVTSAGKAWNLACFKGGLVIGGPKAGDVLANLPPMVLQSMGHFAAQAHAAAMTRAVDWVDEYVGEVQANKALLAGLLAEHLPQARYTPSEGTYFAWVDLSALGLENPARVLRERCKVAFNEGRTFGAEYDGWARVNLATSPAIITEAVLRAAKITG